MPLGKTANTEVPFNPGSYQSTHLHPIRRSKVPETPDLVGAKANDEREKGYYTTQALSERRVRQDETGNWHQLTDVDLSQEKSLHAGAIYESGKKQYWITSTENKWIAASETAVRNYLQHDKKIGKSDHGSAMNFITRTADVELATPLAGYSRGIYNFGKFRILVTESPEIINPVKGEWNTIRKF